MVMVERVLLESEQQKICKLLAGCWYGGQKCKITRNLSRLSVVHKTRQRTQDTKEDKTHDMPLIESSVRQ